MEAPIYHLEGVVKAKEESMEDFVGPLDLILHLLRKTSWRSRISRSPSSWTSTWSG